MTLVDFNASRNNNYIENSSLLLLLLRVVPKLFVELGLKKARLGG